MKNNKCFYSLLISNLLFLVILNIYFYNIIDYTLLFLINLFLFSLFSFILFKFIKTNKFYKTQKDLKEQFNQLLISSDLPVVFADENFSIINCNESFIKFLDSSKSIESYLNKNFFQETNISLIDNKKVSFSNTFNKDQVYNIKGILTTNKNQKYIDLNINYLSKYNMYFIFINDITEYKESEKKLMFEIYSDYLTGEKNKKKFKEEFNEFIENYKKQDKIKQENKAFIALIDIDNFNTVNSSRGYYVGDEIIVYFNGLLKRFIGKLNIDYFHLGGDEFLFVYKGWEKNEVSRNIDELIEYLNNNKNNISDFDLTTSIGVVSYPEHGNSFDTIFKNASISLNHSKTVFGNSYCFFNSKMTTNIIEKQEIILALKQSIENNYEEFSLVYQPKIKFKNDIDFSVDSVEVLLRWNKDFTPISPAKFIPVAENFGLINDLFKFCINRATRDLLPFLGNKISSFSINVSPKQLSSPQQIKYLFEVLENYKKYSKFIMLEITESCIMDNFDIALEALHKIKNMGYKISIDDFGTGHSSLSKMKHLPLDELKIDKSFISNFPNINDENLVKLIIDMGKNFNLDIVAEGVETKKQSDILLAMNCNIIQGFYYSKPISYEKLKKYISEVLI